MSEHGTEPCQWCRGYQEQTAWLEGKSIPESEQALDERLATLAADPYNDGGNVATRDYINREMGAAIRRCAGVREASTP